MNSTGIRQVLYDLRHQPVIGIVTIAGTAMTIFFIMITVMMYRGHVAPFAPESNRPRMLIGKFLHITNTTTNYDGSAGMSLDTAERLFGGLKTAEEVSFDAGNETLEAMVAGGEMVNAYTRYTDDAFFRIFDHEFLAGAPFDKAASDAGLCKAVISEKTARRLFDSPENAIGKTFYLQSVPFEVTGVVAETSPLAEYGSGDVFVPLRSMLEKTWWNFNGPFGPVYAVVLAKSPSDFPAIRAEVNARKQAMNNDLKANEEVIVDHGSPFTMEEIRTVHGSNGDCSADESRKMRYIIYAIFLLIPAINLSSMSRSRLRDRIVEIGVRRAYGATRFSIISRIINENLVVTLIGALLGIVLSMGFGYFFTGFLYADLSTGIPPHIPLGVLFDWQTLGFVILASFVLNLLSAGLPAWRASRIDPVNAINNRL